MAEPESLATLEGLDEHVRRHSYDRLIMLSDGIFAIATTLAALDVRLPLHGSGLLALLAAGRQGLVVYFLSFAFAGMFWINHRNLFARLRRVDTPLTLLTLAMLCLIALIPAMMRTLQGGGDADFRLYGLTMFACGIVGTAMWCWAAFRPGLMLSSVSRRERWGRIAVTAALPALFLPVLLLPPSRSLGIILPLALIVLFARRFLLPIGTKSPKAGKDA